MLCTNQPFIGKHKTSQRSESPASVWLGSPCESSHFISIRYFYRGVLFLLRHISLSWTGPTATQGGAVETDSVVASICERNLIKSNFSVTFESFNGLLLDFGIWQARCAAVRQAIWTFPPERSTNCDQLQRNCRHVDSRSAASLRFLSCSRSQSSFPVGL